MKQKTYLLGLLLATANFNLVLPSQNYVQIPQEERFAQLVPYGQLTIFDVTNEQSKWAFIEKKFITDIHSNKQMTWSHVSALLPAAFATFAGYTYMTQNDIPKYLAQKKENIFFLGGGALSALLVMGQYLEQYLTYQANRTAIQDFFEHWDQNQLYIPKELLPYFTILATKIEAQGQDAVLQDAKTIITDIKFMVTRHFESRYKKFLELDGYNSTAEAKTFSEILKNFIGGAKDLAS